MNLKLAQKLKEAKFPQEKCTEFFTKGEGYEEYDLFRITTKHGRTNLLKNGYDVIACPSLSELIEACGEGSFGLIRPMDEWKATLNGDFGVGKTEEEALVNLYLKLNK